jgi:hypothetical protein
VEDVRPGNKMHVDGVGWCIKLEPQEGVPYNAMVESTFDEYHKSFTEKGAGRLVFVPEGTEVTSGYGWGHR